MVSDVDEVTINFPSNLSCMTHFLLGQSLSGLKDLDRDLKGKCSPEIFLPVDSPILPLSAFSLSYALNFP